MSNYNNSPVTSHKCHFVLKFQYKFWEEVMMHSFNGNVSNYMVKLARIIQDEVASSGTMLVLRPMKMKKLISFIILSIPKLGDE